jgi:hypothetical protein
MATYVAHVRTSARISYSGDPHENKFDPLRADIV